jgi:drug/metabolite transporter (DMT)-like permease
VNARAGESPATQGDAGQERGSRWAGLGLVNLATLTWATNITLARWLRNDIGPLTLAASRFLIAAGLFALLLRQRPRAERRLGKDGWLLAGMALSGVVAFSPTLYLALRHTTAVNVTLINGLGPLITGILASVAIREPMSRRQVVAAVVALAGVVMLLSGGSLTFWRDMRGSQGDLIAVGAVLLWAVYSVLGRKAMRSRSALSATALSAFLGLPVLLLGAAWELTTMPLQIRPELAVGVAYIGAVPTVVGFVAWNGGVRRLGPSGAMVFYNTLPLYGALLGIALLGEPVDITYLLGATLIIGGGLWGAGSRPR